MVSKCLVHTLICQYAQLTPRKRSESEFLFLDQWRCFVLDTLSVGGGRVFCCVTENQRDCRLTDLQQCCPSSKSRHVHDHGFRQKKKKKILIKILDSKSCFLLFVESKKETFLVSGHK